MGFRYCWLHKIPQASSPIKVILTRKIGVCDGVTTSTCLFTGMCALLWQKTCIAIATEKRKAWDLCQFHGKIQQYRNDLTDIYREDWLQKKGEKKNCSITFLLLSTSLNRVEFIMELGLLGCYFSPGIWEWSCANNQSKQLLASYRKKSICTYACDSN